MTERGKTIIAAGALVGTLTASAFLTGHFAQDDHKAELRLIRPPAETTAVPKCHAEDEVLVRVAQTSFDWEPDDFGCVHIDNLLGPVYR